LFFAFPTLFVRKLLIISKLLVEAAGVEPDISVENAQLTDSRNDSFAGNAMISKSTVRSLYSDCQQFPEPQPSDLYCK
jgi:C-terminal processing protease CtpA/Prc